MSEYLRARFQELTENGLVDVKFDIRMMPDHSGEKEPVQEFADVCAELETLYRAVDAGFSSPLDFGDTNHLLA